MKKILIVDDDPKMYRLYRTIFEMENYEVEVAEDGLEGLSKAKSFHPDAILLDIMMKNVNGLQALTTLKADPAVKDIPVVVLSNVTDPAVMNEAKAKGAVEFVVKSDTEPNNMAALVRALLAKTGKAGTLINEISSGEAADAGQDVPAAPTAPTATTEPPSAAEEPNNNLVGNEGLEPPTSSV